MRRATVAVAGLFVLISPPAAVAKDDTLSSMWDLLEPGEASIGLRDDTIVDTSSGWDPKAPATAMMMRAASPCLAEVSGTVQWPGEWAALTKSTYDFRKVGGYRFYAGAGPFDLNTPSLSPEDAGVHTIVLIGKEFTCAASVKLKPGAQTFQHSCDDSFFAAVFSPPDREKVLRALAKLQAACGMPSFGK